jgi:hypothetical protein
MPNASVSAERQHAQRRHHPARPHQQQSQAGAAGAKQDDGRQQQHHPFNWLSLLVSIEANVLADAIDQDAQHHHRDQHVEEDAQLDHQRHAVGGERDGGEHHAVFHRQQRQHLRDGLAAVDHQEEAGQHERDGDASVLLPSRSSEVNGRATR